jgi:diguanylate cyclase (GGDEF)-like protein
LRRQHARTTVARDPVLGLLIGAGVLCCAVFFAIPGDQRLLLRLLWLLQVPMDAVFVILAWRVGTVMPAGPARRFWRVLSGGVALFGIGDSVELVMTLYRPDAKQLDGGPVQTGFFVVGCAAIVLSMLMYPMPASTRRERLRFWLDSISVLTGGGVLAWYFAVNPVGTGQIDWVTTVVAAGVVLVAAFAAVKLVLVGAAPMSTAAAAPMIAAAFLQGVGILITPSGATTVEPGMVALRFVPGVLLALGPRIQELQARANPTALLPEGRRRYSVLPYLAVAVAYAVLLAILPTDLGIRIMGVVAGVVIITGAVVLRQLLAFRDNAELIGQLDTAVLELRGHQALLREQATHDGLTGLANRTEFTARVEEALAGPGGVTVLLIDLDDFKAVNDTLGHGVGDDLLITVAERLRGAVRDGDLVARLGGDEFAVLLRGRSSQDPGRFAARILADVAQPVRIGDHTLAVRASIGVALAGPGDDLEGLLRNADIAMYAAKDSGKGSFQRYAPDMAARLAATAEVAARLREALDDGQFHLVYQPIVDLGSGAVVGAEALVRWDRPGLAPAEFIPIAEQTGLIVPLGRWILREACLQVARWRAAHPEALLVVLNVNIAARQLQEPGLVEEIAGALAEAALPADRLTIEVTETPVLHSAETRDALRALRRLGVGLALDDFGTAASSLGLLLTCPVSALKLDRSFVDGIALGSRQAAVAVAVVQVARALELSAVAEGVETMDQADLLHGFGYRLAQGNLFSHPLRGEDFTRVWSPQVHAVGADRGGG